MSDVKVKVWVKTRMHGSMYTDEIEIDKSEFDDMSESKLSETCFDAAIEMIDWGYEVIDS